MPLTDDGVISKEPDGSFNEDYCKWCYSGGSFVYSSKEKLIDYIVEHTPNPDNIPEKERRIQFDGFLSTLKYWS